MDQATYKALETIAVELKLTREMLGSYMQTRLALIAADLEAELGSTIGATDALVERIHEAKAWKPQQ